MTRRILFSVGLATVLSFGAAAATSDAAIVFSYDFENVNNLGPSPYDGTGNTANPNNPAVGTISLTEPGGGSQIQIINGSTAPDPGSYDATTGKYVRLVNIVGSTPNLQTLFSKEAGDIEADMLWYGLGRLQVRGQDGIYLEIQSILNEEGQFELQRRNTTAGGSTYTTFATVSKAWHRITLVTQAAAGTFQVKVDGTPVETALGFLDNAPAGTPSFNRLYFVPSGTTTLPFYLDNVVVDSVPEPAMAGLGGLAALALGRRRRRM